MSSAFTLVDLGFIFKPRGRVATVCLWTTGGGATGVDGMSDEVLETCLPFILPRMVNLINYVINTL
jgi:hypothetical protein